MFSFSLIYVSSSISYPFYFRSLSFTSAFLFKYVPSLFSSSFLFFHDGNARDFFLYILLLIFKLTFIARKRRGLYVRVWEGLRKQQEGASGKFVAFSCPIFVVLFLNTEQDRWGGGGQGRGRGEAWHSFITRSQSVSQKKKSECPLFFDLIISLTHYRGCSYLLPFFFFFLLFFLFSLRYFTLSISYVI